jgi:hypothetical protein
VFNVTDAEYGADPTGAVSSSTAIENAIEAAATAGGGVVYLPLGSYYIDSSITVISRRIHLIGGTGPAAFPIGNPGVELITDQSIIILDWGDDTQARHEGPHIENISFRDSNATPAATGGLRLTRMNGFTLTNCFFKDFEAGYGLALNGGAAGWCQYGSIFQMRVGNCKYGIRTFGKVTDITMYGGYFRCAVPYIANSIAISEGSSGAGRWSLYGVGFNDWANCVVLDYKNDWVFYGTTMEQTTTNKGNGTAIDWNGDGTANTGLSLRVIGCKFTSWDTGITVGANAWRTALIANSFSDVTTHYNINSNAVQTTILNSHEDDYNRFFTLAFDSDPEYTIASGVITIDGTSSKIRIDTESDASTDDLDTISGGAAYMIIYISAADPGRTVVAKDGVGNLKLAGDFSLTHSDDRLVLMRGSGSTWFELSRSDNTA